MASTIYSVRITKHPKMAWSESHDFLNFGSSSYFSNKLNYAL